MAYWVLLLHNLSNCTVTAVLSQHKDRLVLDFDEFATPLFFPCESVKWIRDCGTYERRCCLNMLHRKLLAVGATVLLRLVVFLDLQKTPSGYKISTQEDHVLWLESLRKNLPGVNNVYEIYVRRATGLFIVNTMQVIGLADSFQHGSEVALAFAVQDKLAM